MTGPTPQERPYSPLPDEMKPSYSTRSDFRLLQRAYRWGWVRGVPAERQHEWHEDISNGLTQDSDTSAKIGAVWACLAVHAYRLRLRKELRQLLFPPIKRPQGRPRKRRA